MVHTSKRTSSTAGLNEGVLFSPKSTDRYSSEFKVVDNPVHVVANMIPMGHEIVVERLHDTKDCCLDIPPSPVMSCCGCSELMLFNQMAPDCQNGIRLQNDIWLTAKGRYRLFYKTGTLGENWIYQVEDSVVGDTGALGGSLYNCCPDHCTPEHVILGHGDPIAPPDCLRCEAPIYIDMDSSCIWYWAALEGSTCEEGLDTGEWISNCCKVGHVTISSAPPTAPPDCEKCESPMHIDQTTGCVYYWTAPSGSDCAQADSQGEWVAKCFCDDLIAELSGGVTSIPINQAVMMGGYIAGTMDVSDAQDGSVIVTIDQCDTVVDVSDAQDGSVTVSLCQDGNSGGAIDVSDNQGGGVLVDIPYVCGPIDLAAPPITGEIEFTEQPDGSFLSDESVWVTQPKLDCEGNPILGCGGEPLEEPVRKDFRVCCPDVDDLGGGANGGSCYFIPIGTDGKDSRYDSLHGGGPLVFDFNYTNSKGVTQYIDFTIRYYTHRYTPTGDQPFQTLVAFGPKSLTDQMLDPALSNSGDFYLRDVAFAIHDIPLHSTGYAWFEGPWVPPVSTTDDYRGYIASGMTLQVKVLPGETLDYEGFFATRSTTNVVTVHSFFTWMHVEALVHDGAA